MGARRHLQYVTGAAICCDVRSITVAIQRCRRTESKYPDHRVVDGSGAGNLLRSGSSSWANSASRSSKIGGQILRITYLVGHQVSVTGTAGAVRQRASGNDPVTPAGTGSRRRAARLRLIPIRCRPSWLTAVRGRCPPPDARRARFTATMAYSIGKRWSSVTADGWQRPSGPRRAVCRTRLRPQGSLHGRDQHPAVLDGCDVHQRQRSAAPAASDVTASLAGGSRKGHASRVRSRW